MTRLALTRRALTRRLLPTLPALLLARPRPAAATMQILVRTRTGQVIVIDVDSADTIQNVKARVAEQQGIPAAQQSLSLAGRVLEDGRTIADYGIRAGATLALTLRPR